MMKKIATIMAIVFTVCLLMTGQSMAAGEQKTSETGQTKTWKEGQTTEMQTGQMRQGSGQGMQASKLMDMEVQDQNQKKLGTVSDLFVSEDGKVEYLIISKGGMMGMGEDLIPIPWDQVQQMDQEEALTVNIDEQKLENAPTFSENDFQQPGWQQEVRGYYGQEQQGHMKMKEGGEMKKESGEMKTE